MNDLVENLLLNGLTALVELVQGFGQLFGGLHVGGIEQVKGHAGVGHASGRIDPWCDPKGDVFGTDPPGADIAGRQQSLYPGPGAGVELAQAGFGQDAVYAGQRRHVGNGSQRHQIAEDLQIGFLSRPPPADLAQSHAKGDRQIECHAHTGQAGEFKRLILQLGIDHRLGGRNVIDVVMIGDNHIDTEAPGRFHGVGAA